MVAVRSLTGPTPPHPGDRVRALALRWAETVPTTPTALDRTAVAARLATLLRRLGVVLRAEPYWPLGARALGAELLACGPAGDRQPVEDVLAPSLALLRREGPEVFDLSGPDDRRRLTAALDELAAGFARAVREQAVRQESVAGGLRREGPERARVAAVDALHYRAVYTQGPVGIAIVDLDSRILDMNPALCAMFGLAALDQPRPASDFVHPDDLPQVLTRYRDLVRGTPEVIRMDARLVRPNRDLLWTHLVGSLVRTETGDPSHVIMMVEDVSERFALRSRLHRAASEDQLTRLPNRALTERALRRAFAPDGATTVGLCAVDVDRFSAVNEGLGHPVGDRLLVALAARLELAAGGHLLTRTGGDQFAVVVADPGGVCAVSHVADRVLASLATPFSVDGHELVVTASAGVAVADTDTGRPEELMRAANVALSWAKARGGGRRVVFDPERDAGEAARFTLLAGLRGGVDRGEFRVVYQPLVRLRDGTVRGAEALVRWQHPAEGLLGPNRFIDLAERSGAIVALGRWVLTAACAEAVRWVGAVGEPVPYVSVNVSPVQLCEPGLVSAVAEALTSTGLPADRLQLEITEQAVMADEAVALRTLGQLREAGVRLALDDFGTGYSGLAWLRRLPVQALKIDGSFIDGLRHPEPVAVDVSIMRALLEMAHALELEVTAEWVENERQARRLTELGCDQGQGRWFGDPGPAHWVSAPVRRRLSHREGHQNGPVPRPRSPRESPSWTTSSGTTPSRSTE